LKRMFFFLLLCRARHKSSYAEHRIMPSCGLVHL
jgi:hypothetical protein